MIQQIDISLLKTNLNNVKYHNKKNIESIKKSLSEFKQYKPLIINDDYQILVGKGTFLAMKQLKYKTVFVVKKSISKKEQQELIILDNRTSQLSEMNNDIIENVFYDLDKQKINITGYSDSQMENIMNDISKKQLDDQTDKINNFQITCPYCHNSFAVKQD